MMSRPDPKDPVSPWELLMFLSSSNYKNEILGIVHASDTVRVAVAFWGSGSEKLLEQTQMKCIRIICNLMSGGTNPDPIRKLLEQTHIELRHLTSLHAKVVLGTNAAIVGSANHSTDGLNHEPDEDTGWYEAGLTTHDKNQLKQIEKWFEDLWLVAKPISNRDLILAQEQWNRRRQDRATTSTASGLLNQPVEYLKDRQVYLVIYEVMASKEAKKAYAEVIDSLKAGNEEVASSKALDFFERANYFPTDASLISIYLGPRGAVKVEGPYRRFPALDKEFIDAYGKQQSIQIVAKEKAVLGHLFDSATRQQLVQYVKHNVEQIREKAEAAGWVIPLYEALTNEG